MSANTVHRLTIFRSSKTMPEILAERGFPLDLRCGGKGTCGRCLIELLEGRWESNGKELLIPGQAKACQVRLLSDTGEIAIPETSLQHRNGKMSSDWAFGNLPDCADPVIAIDLGTTTIAAVKIHQGRILKRASCYNAQNRFGDNVIARISHAEGSAENLVELQQAAVASINELLAELDTENVSRIAIAGNTVMSTILHGIDPSPLGKIPFTPPMRIFPVRKASEFGLNAEVPLDTVPAISAYIGGDLTAGLAELRLTSGEMLVDIGTNCEIIFHAPQGLVCAAAAAGPAFEGAGIHSGMRAVDGAIDHYFGKGKFSVIGNTGPKGICGSGMLDFLAVERQAGHLNEFGRLQPQHETFELAPEVFLHEWDIAQLLKAKAAISSGIHALEEFCQSKAAKIHLAGGFAQYLNLNNAIAIGMLPPGREYSIVGNTSLAGAAHLACLPEFADTLEKYIESPQEIHLNALPTFEDHFIDNLLLP
jgi:uncharacterized 2Fe-2S/4Fe-4S cluster protein (DUF4445 family)